MVWTARRGRNTATEICRTVGDPWGLVAVLEIEAADAVEQRRGGEEHGCRRALLGSLAALDWRLQTASVFLQARRDRARIYGVADNASVCPAARDAHSKECIGRLALTVSPERRVRNEIE